MISDSPLHCFSLVRLARCWWLSRQSTFLIAFISLPERQPNVRANAASNGVISANDSHGVRMCLFSVHPAHARLKGSRRCKLQRATVLSAVCQERRRCRRSLTCFPPWLEWSAVPSMLPMPADIQGQAESTTGGLSVTERCNRLALLVTSPLILADRCEECSRLVGKKPLVDTALPPESRSTGINGELLSYLPSILCLGSKSWKRR